jgi:hypothetical protein
MKVRLTRKLSNILNGVDLSGFQNGDTLDLPARDATMLVAEGWAERATDGQVSASDRADDRSDRSRRR